MIVKITSLFHYDPSKNSKVKCDASQNVLGACLEQEIEPGVCFPTSFASRFPNNAEGKCSINELELLAFVWACEHFRTYLLGTHFQVLTDHKVIILALNESYNNKSYHSRLPDDSQIVYYPSILRLFMFLGSLWLLLVTYLVT